MKKSIVIILVVMLTFVFAATVFAVGPGKKLEFEDGAVGKVEFSGDVHKTFKCNECHPAIFKMKKSKLTMKEINAGKECGTCHNGTKAFSAKECKKCHKK